MLKLMWRLLLMRCSPIRLPSREIQRLEEALAHCRGGGSYCGGGEAAPFEKETEERADTEEAADEAPVLPRRRELWLRGPLMQLKQRPFLRQRHPGRWRPT
ncbi:hypothetical protein NHX12_018358 [Muraenolepis orangiensis]|uniref:Uncharacterized protein n=1 Tax=Muraenolepis orangiensis TaxID=630683 RepID=A0A9Q0IYH1_9TELE|nr:hypothetical protein NHX12_018358 [Muraenolepis orangiensis]